MFVFRPCIDLRRGRVTQIVGGTLDTGSVAVNFESDRAAGWFARRYRDDGLTGGHVIMLGPGNDDAARDALGAWPGGMQIGGGITAANAETWLASGASHVIVTSYLFDDGRLSQARLDSLLRAVGREKLVLDLSCRKRGDDYVVVVDRWQRFTDVTLSAAVIADLSSSCAELLVHGVDVEGTRQGMDLELVARLAEWAIIPVTYAGGASSIDDLEHVHRVGRGRVNLTIGSALDLFGGTEVRYADCVAFNRRVAAQSETDRAGDPRER
jgi:phosphoribosylformimino-5-aminoimidazole carboxamide ribotide isomerase